MDKNILGPILAGVGLGFLAFHPEGQKMAKGLGQSVLPALTGGGKPDNDDAGKDGEESPDRRKDKDEE